MARVCYFISDLHIGGDEALGVCDFEDELVAFLEELASREGEEAELLILGDAFGLWEFTEIKGPEKVDALIRQFPRIFEALRKAGETITITLLPGNHDYELACYPEFVETLGRYNVRLEQSVAVTRELGTRSVRAEHGNQHDETNRMPDFGNPYAQPVGFHVTSTFVGGAGKVSERGRYNWLKDIQSVYPTEDIPHWVLSNYFYREMSPLLRWALVPFLLLFGVTFIVLGGAALEFFGFAERNVFLENRLLEGLGVFGSLVQLVLTVNAVLLAEALVLAAPLYLILKDLKRTARRFGLDADPAELTGEKEDQYIDAARRAFREDPRVAVFVYGHTHKPSLRRVGERAVLNTGTWIKRFDRMPPRLGLLPQVYVPSFCLNYFRLFEEDDRVVIEYRTIDKTPERELNLLQRMIASSKRRASPEAIPARTVLGVGMGELNRPEKLGARVV
jgi:UDP-2,3-diacylglucosamine pyrophosphatase LpxH